ncbi:MAG: STAS domain-containing protein [Pirellulales bacterium]
MTWQREGDVTKVRFAGSLTNAELDQTKDCLAEAIGADFYSRPVVFDLSRVDYLDSCAIGWILKRHRSCKEQGGKLVLQSPSPLVRKLLSMLKIEKVVAVADDAKQADALCGTGGGVA